MTKSLIKSNLDEYEQLFLALADKTRLRLLTLMANEPVSVGFLVDELGESQPKVSRHLAYLRNACVVNTRRDGKRIYYGIQQSEDADIHRIVRFVIDTLTDATADEQSYIRGSRQSRPIDGGDARTKLKEAENPIAYHQTHYVEVETKMTEDADDMWRIDDDEAVSDMATRDDELEIFLL